eukprot:Colp12_sorted_trinity150504_noHs@20212
MKRKNEDTEEEVPAKRPHTDVGAEVGGTLVQQYCSNANSVAEELSSCIEKLAQLRKQGVKQDSQERKELERQATLLLIELRALHREATLESKNRRERPN